MHTYSLADTAAGPERFKTIRAQTEAFCSYLQPEDTVVQPIVDVSPPKWHLAHTTWFFENFLLKKFAPGYKEFHPQFSFLFNSYYESVGERVERQNRGFMTRPALNEVLDFRHHVNEAMSKLLKSGIATDDDTFRLFLEMGLQHEQQHMELLVTDTLYILSLNPLHPAYRADLPALPKGSNKPVSYIKIPGGLHTIGYDGLDFAWDNERPVHEVNLQPYALADLLVTNREYLDFMMDGGYRNFQFWLSEGWALVETQNWEAPLYWHKGEDGEWKHFTLGGLQTILLDAPVTHISFFEADAYATWAGKRLPTEQEWEAGAKHLGIDIIEKGNYLESGLLQPSPATEGNMQMGGDVWEWTYSGYFPYPGYRRAEGALGEYNGKFMINQMVLRGGSCATPVSHIRPTYRNFWPTDKRWQFTGIRLAE